MPPVGVQHGAADDHVGLAEQLGQPAGPATSATFGRPAATGPGAHRGQPRAERREPPGHGGADGAEADDEHGRVQQRPAGGPALSPRASAALASSSRRASASRCRTAISSTLSASPPALPGTRQTHTPSSVATGPRPRPSRPTPYWCTRPKRPASEDGRADPGAERADHVDAVEVLGHPAGRQCGQLPAGQQRRRRCRRTSRGLICCRVNRTRTGTRATGGRGAAR